MITITIFRIFSLMLGLYLTVVVSRDHWQNHRLNYTNFFYPFMKELLPPDFVGSNKTSTEGRSLASKVPIAILTVDSESIKKYGWPVSAGVWKNISKKLRMPFQIAKSLPTN